MQVGLARTKIEQRASAEFGVDKPWLAAGLAKLPARMG
jgi:hypothetical protein